MDDGSNDNGSGNENALPLPLEIRMNIAAMLDPAAQVAWALSHASGNLEVQEARHMRRRRVVNGRRVGDALLNRLAVMKSALIALASNNLALAGLDIEFVNDIYDSLTEINFEMGLLNYTLTVANGEVAGKKMMAIREVQTVFDAWIAPYRNDNAVPAETKSMLERFGTLLNMLVSRIRYDVQALEARSDVLV